MHFLVILFIIFICNQGSIKADQCDTNALCGCSIPSIPQTRIIGGDIALKGSWPWAVSLRYFGAHICGGTILSSYFIITAAHCVNNVTNLNRLTILAGSTTLDLSSSTESYQIHSINQIIQHINYDFDNSFNDIALLRLATPINMENGNLKPICLPTGTSVEPGNDIDMVAIGWGVTSMTSTSISSDLRQVTVKSMDSTSSDCEWLIGNSTIQFCAGIDTGGKDTCEGDSGGPLMALVNGLWQLHGITSYGYGCALAGAPGVYTRVSYYISWINSNMQLYDPITTTTERTSSSQTILSTLINISSNKTNNTTENDLFVESTSQMSNNAKYSKIQSFTITFLLPIITSVYSVLFVFLF